MKTKNIFFIFLLLVSAQAFPQVKLASGGKVKAPTSEASQAASKIRFHEANLRSAYLTNSGALVTVWFSINNIGNSNVARIENVKLKINYIRRFHRGGGEIADELLWVYSDPITIEGPFGPNARKAFTIDFNFSSGREIFQRDYNFSAYPRYGSQVAIVTLESAQVVMVNAGTLPAVIEENKDESRVMPFRRITSTLPQ